jgi:bifunctional non-homologous end joining protein LigD
LNRAAYEVVREVALKLRDILQNLSLTPFIKTSGKTGLHIYVPVMRHYDYAVIRKACATIGSFLSDSMTGAITMDRVVNRRAGKIFFDHNQNARGRTLAAPYSLRPSAWATVATPISWDELTSVYPTDFTIATVPGRLAKIGDPWDGIIKHKHDLRPIFES